MVRGAPITTASVTTRMDLTISQLLHDVDIVLGMNWLKYVNPIIDWCSGQVYLPGAVHTALLKGTWLSSEHAIGTVKILSNSVDIEDLKNDAIQNSLAILKTPKFWNAVNSRTNFSTGDVHRDISKEDCTKDCKKLSGLFIQHAGIFGHLYIKKLKNSSAIPKRAT